MQNKFQDLWKRINGKENPKFIFETLNNLYSQPHRFYHNLTHIDHCLKGLSCVKSIAEDFDSLELAIWYHDAIYDTHRKDNEIKSAELAKKICERNYFTENFTAKVYGLIIHMDHIIEPNNLDAKILNDVDLSILGQERDIFKKYEDNIKKEYIWVPSDIFKIKRRKILQHFLDRDSVYFTTYFRNKYEKKAEINLQKSIDALKYF